MGQETQQETPAWKKKIVRTLIGLLEFELRAWLLEKLYMAEAEMEAPIGRWRKDRHRR